MEAFLIAMMIAATPFLFAGMGELVAERSGVLNLGVEGMMLMGAVTAFAVSHQTGSSILAIVAGAGGAAHGIRGFPGEGGGCNYGGFGANMQPINCVPTPN